MGLFDLTGKKALVTGSSQGLGFAMAEGLGQAGAAVMLNGRNYTKLEQAKNSLRSKGVEAYGYAFDVTQEKTVTAAVDNVEKDVGPIDILVNNAGINLRHPVVEFPAEQWREIMNTNLDGVFYMSKAIGKKMIERGKGKIINIASLMSEVVRPTVSAYSASKGAVKMFTKGLAVELAKHNVQVNAIGPGYFLTELNKPLIEDEQFNAWVLDKTPAGRWGEPSELIGTAVYLASDASNFVTGQIIYVDGGCLSAL